MKRAFLSLILTLFLALIALPASANLILNGDFETGDLSDWIVEGDVVVTEAGPFAEAQGMEGYYALLGFDAHSGDWEEQEVSQLTQGIDVTGYTMLTISFNWAFDYFDNTYQADDTFLAFIEDDENPALSITFLDLSTNGGFFDPVAEIAFGTFSETYDISSFTDDEANVVFRLVEGSSDNWLTGTLSAAGIDNVEVSGVAPVPEPATMVLMGFGLVGLASISRKQLFKK